MSLQQFLDDARNRIAGGGYDTPHELPNNGSLAAALARPDAIIAELKPRSPSEGRILDTQPGNVLADYVRGGAAALSILTDADHFDGSLDLLAAAHATGLPTLMKDFILDERQLDAANACGASAVLLIERCLTPTQRERLVEAAHERGLEVLLEVHGDEAPQVLESKADLIGVNARDLDTLAVDPDGALQAIKDLAAAGKRVVALSGIHDRAGVQKARASGATACLVGTHLMRHPDRALALRALRHPVAKVCGITNDAGLDAVIAAGADLAGFIVGADSPRSMGSLEAQQLAGRARDAGLSTVLVTPHMDDWEVREWCRVVRPNWLQLHGLRPSPEWVHSLKAVGTHVMHAVGPDSELSEAEGWVFDAPEPGSGETHDWDAVAARLPQGFTLIAGGLDASNAATAVTATGAWGADASSRLESSPGVKDPERVAAFVRAVQETP